MICIFICIFSFHTLCSTDLRTSHILRICFSIAIDIDILYIYTPNLGPEITVSNQKREHSRVKGSIEGAKAAL